MALRIVQASEEPRPAAPLRPAVQTGTPASVRKAVAAFKSRIAKSDVKAPLQAIYLACAASKLMDTAMGLYHQAVAHAAPSTFRRDTPPGMKSAEATMSWLRTHLDYFRKHSSDKDAATTPYPRDRDLTEAAQFSSAELERAVETASVVGLDSSARIETMFGDIVRGFDEVAVWKAPSRSNVLAEDSDYVIGTDVLIMCHQ